MDDIKTQEQEQEQEILEIEKLPIEELMRRENRTKELQLEEHIYCFYPALKQQQDTAWSHNFTTKLYAIGIKNLDNQIVGFTASFYKGKSLNDILINIDNDLVLMYEKLIKVAVRNEWAYNCILASAEATKNNTDADYPVFPRI